MDITHQLPRWRAVYVSLSLDSLVRPFLPTSPGGADSTNEATVACFEAIVFVVTVCEYAKQPNRRVEGRWDVDSEVDPGRTWKVWRSSASGFKDCRPHILRQVRYVSRRMNDE